MPHPVCRVCLASKMKIFVVNNIKLISVFEKLTNIKIHSNIAAQRTFCYICYRKLQKCLTFSEMAQRSQQILSLLIYSGVAEVTHEAISKLNHEVKPELTAFHSQVMIIEDTNKITVNVNEEIKDEPLELSWIKEEDDCRLFEDLTEIVDDAESDIITECTDKEYATTVRDVENRHLKRYGGKKRIKKDPSEKCRDCVLPVNNLESFDLEEFGRKEIPEEVTRHSFADKCRDKECEIRDAESSDDGECDTEEMMTADEPHDPISDKCTDKENKSPVGDLQRPYPKGMDREIVKETATECESIAEENIDNEHIDDLQDSSLPRTAEDSIEESETNSESKKIETKPFKDLQKSNQEDIAREKDGPVATKRKREMVLNISRNKVIVAEGPFNQIESSDSNSKLLTIQGKLITHKRKVFKKNVREKDPNMQKDSEKSVVLKLMKLPPDLQIHHCPPCKKQFLSKNDLDNHLLKEHITDKLKCPICGIRYTNEEVFARHRKSHKKKKYCLTFPHLKHSSFKCEKLFASKTVLKRHQKLHLCELKYACFICGKRCYGKPELNKHFHTHKLLQCGVCDQIISGVDVADEHIDSHRSGLMMCSECGKYFANRTSLIEHLRLHSGEPKLLCPYCDGVFVNKTALAEHVLTHNDCFLQCCVCKRLFNKHSKFARHLYSHVNCVIFKCFLCGRRFKLNSLLQRHLELHKFFTLSCAICDKNFTSPAYFKKHMKEHSLTCSICDKKSGCQSSFRKHMKSHVGEDAYVCDMCGSTFSEKSELLTHIRSVHRGAKPFSCSFCARNVLLRDSYITHMSNCNRDPSIECRDEERVSPVIDLENCNPEEVDPEEVIIEEKEPYDPFVVKKTNEESDSPFKDLQKSSLIGVATETASDGESIDNKDIDKDLLEDLQDYSPPWVAEDIIKETATQCETTADKNPENDPIEDLQKSNQEDVAGEKSGPVATKRKTEMVHNISRDEVIVAEGPFNQIESSDSNSKLLTIQGKLITHDTKLSVHNATQNEPTIQIDSEKSVVLKLLKLTPDMKENINKVITSIRGAYYVQLANAKTHNPNMTIKKYECADCGMRFRRKTFLARHVQRHVFVRKYVCFVCGKRFYDISQRDCHLDTHEALKCCICSEIIRDKAMAEKHIEKHRSKLTKCSVSGKYYTRKQILANQLRLNLGGPKIFCPYCIETFDDKTKLTSHVIMHNKIQLQCCVCNKLLKRQYDFDRHIKAHVYAFKCSFCGKGFTFKEQLIRHRQLHADEKFSCDICNKQLSSRKTLKGHLKTHMDERLFLCHICGKNFNQKPSLKQHLKVHAEEPYSCADCGKTYTKKINLTRHIWTHSKRRSRLRRKT